MNNIVYYVASSLDGFISGPDDDIEGYVASGSGLAKYREDLGKFETVIMGRRTYEFGYQYGLKKGMPAYPHMQHFIFSNSLKFEEPHAQVNVRPYNLDEIEKIRNEAPGDIYLCGGGVFAGWLLDLQQINMLKIKLSPLILGAGIRIFGASSQKYQLDLIESEEHDEGLLINTYALRY